MTANHPLTLEMSHNLSMLHFGPQMSPEEWDAIDESCTPARVLSDLFWKKLDWPLIQSELGKIQMFDSGCGRTYAHQLQHVSGKRIAKYHGVDAVPRDNWDSLQEQHPFISVQQAQSDALFDVIPHDTNCFITQSAIEHFEDDLHFFKSIQQFIEVGGKNTLQMHLFPSAACLKLYRLHGVRQYTPRTIAKIIELFQTGRSYHALYKLGGPHCNHVHNEFITKAQARGGDGRLQKRQEYRSHLVSAMKDDFANPNNSPTFYALVIHSNYQRILFQDPRKVQ